MEVVNQRRTLTDAPILILFVVFFCAWFGTAIYALSVVEVSDSMINLTVAPSSILLICSCAVVVAIFLFLEFLTIIWVPNSASKWFLLSVIFFIILITLACTYPGFTAIVNTYHGLGYFGSCVLIFTLISTEWFHLPQKVLEETCRIIMKSKALVLFIVVWHIMNILMAIFGATAVKVVKAIPGLPPKLVGLVKYLGPFGTQWFVSFIAMFGHAVLFATFASYFWNQQCDKFIVLRCIKFISRYHLGTLAFSSSHFSILPQLYILSKYLIKTGKERRYGCSLFWLILYNFLGLMVFNWMTFCGTMIGIVKGKGYYESVKESFDFLLRYPRRCFLVYQVSDCVSQAIAFCAMGSVIICIVFFSLIQASQIPNIFDDIYIVGWHIFIVLPMTLLKIGQLAVLICLLEDLELHDGSSANPYVMSNDLQLALAHDGPPQWYRKCLDAMSARMSAFASLILSDV